MFKKFSATLAVLTALPFCSHAIDHWEFEWNSVSLYDGPTSALIHKFPLHGAVQSSSRDMCPPALAIAPSGEAYVTSNAHPLVWRVDPASLRVERFELEVDADQSKDFGFSNLAWSADGTTLHAMSSTGRATWRLDLAAGKAFKVAGAASTGAGCR